MTELLFQVGPSVARPSAEGLWQYLWTPDPAAQAVIWVLFALFVLWFFGLLWTAGRLLIERRTLRKLKENVAALAERSRGQDDAGLSLEDRDQAFEAFLNEEDIKAKRTVTQHVKSIFDAGWSDTRLDVGELNQHAGRQLFRSNTLLKSVLGIFIVVGLFGTLLGLSKALVPLSSLDLTGGGGVASDVAPLLQDLLRKLKSAFAPSLWGVLLTVVGVLLYGAYLNFLCQPLKNRLDRASLDKFVPQLYPTTSQRVLETLEEADRQAHENLKAAEKVADFAEGLGEEVENFAPKVQDANGLLDSFNSSLEKADTATERFSNAIEQFSSFQETLETAFEEMKENSREVRTLFRTVNKQNEALGERLEALQELEATYAEQQEETAAALDETTAAAQKAFQKLGQRNEEVVQAVGEPLVEQLEALRETLNEELQKVEADLRRLQDPLQDSAQRIEGVAAAYPENTEELLQKVEAEVFNELGEPLGEGLENVDETLYERLGELEQRLARLEGPVESSAGRLEGIAESFDQSMAQLMQQVQEEFHRQNQVSGEHGTNLETLNQRLEELAEQQQTLIDKMESTSEYIAQVSARYTFADFLRDKFTTSKNGR